MTISRLTIHELHELLIKKEISAIELTKEHLDRILRLDSNVKAYIAANIELDRALENLLKYLEEAGKLDDTVIVISPDHYPYGLRVNEINEVSKINRDDKFDLYKTSLIIYNSEITEPIIIDKYV